MTFRGQRPPDRGTYRLLVVDEQDASGRHEVGPELVNDMFGGHSALAGAGDGIREGLRVAASAGHMRSMPNGTETAARRFKRRSSEFFNCARTRPDLLPGEGHGWR